MLLLVRLFEVALVLVCLDHVAESILKNFFTAIVYVRASKIHGDDPFFEPLLKQVVKQ